MPAFVLSPLLPAQGFPSWLNPFPWQPSQKSRWSIIDVMRAGPSTGMPTKVEQSDIRYAIASGHGDAEKIVLAASSIEDCYYITQEAFNLAERSRLR